MSVNGKSAFFSVIQQYLSKTKRLQSFLLRLAILGLGGAIFLFVHIIGILLEETMYLIPEVKIILWAGGIILSLVGSFLYYLWIKNREIDTISKFKLPKTIRHGFELHREFHLRRENQYAHYAIKQLAKDNSRFNIKTYLKKWFFRQIDICFGIGIIVGFLLIGLLYLGVLSYYPSSAMRLWNMTKSYSTPNPFVFKIVPENTQVVYGDSVVPKITFLGKDLPKKIELHFGSDSASLIHKKLVSKQNNDPIYQPSPIKINHSLWYIFFMDGFRSSPYYIKALYPPNIDSLVVTVHPPSYTNLATHTHLYPQNHILAYPGSLFSIYGKSKQSLSKATIWSGNNSQEKSILKDSQTIEYKQKIQVGKDTLSVSLINEHNVSTVKPYKWYLEPKEDKWPTISIISPDPIYNLVSPYNQQIDIQYQLKDDFGITELRFFFQVQRKDGYVIAKDSSISLPIPPFEQVTTFSWLLDSLNLIPGYDTFYWLTVTDNDEFHGGKRVATPRNILHIPSFIEELEQVDLKEDNIQTELNEAQQIFEEFSNQLNQLKQDLVESPRDQITHQLNLDKAKEQQNSLSKYLEELSEDFEKFIDQLDISDNILSEETIQAYKELEKLFDEVQNDEIMKYFDDLEKSLNNLNHNRLRNALKNIEFNEQLYRERIDRTIELFKQVQLKSNLNKIANLANDLAKEQEKTGEESHSDPSNEIKKAETLIKEKTTLDSLIQKIEHIGSFRFQQEISDFVKEQKETLKNLEQNLKQWQEKIKKEPFLSKKNIEEHQKKISQVFRNIQKQAEDLEQKIESQQQQINIEMLVYVFDHLLLISEKQEIIQQNINGLENGDLAFVSAARDSRHLERLFSQFVDSLTELSKVNPMLSNQVLKKKLQAEQKNQLLLEKLAQREISSSSILLTESLSMTNELAAMIVDILENIADQQSNPGGSGGAGEQFKQLSKEQRQLNDFIEQYINDIQGQRLSNEQLNSFDEFAKRQQELRSKLKQLQKTLNESGYEHLQSQLKQIERAMQDAINDLRGASYGKSASKRQNEILSRLLESEKAHEERGEDDDKFEGKTPDRIISPLPKTKIETLSKLLKTQFNPRYTTPYNRRIETLIERYLEMTDKLFQERIEQKEDDSSINK